ncbi:ABC transporter substrate-binding protein [Aeromonas jandaei]|uniref:ABC transporter substrate-binding protein n=1 Tax=Aeromonas jandaei TaxID=650 RepID=UPI003989307B
MNQRHRLLQLESTLGPYGEGDITLAELEKIFCCSRRNIQLILAALVEEGWIHWSPGRGRGNRSHITLRHAYRQLTYQEALDACQSGQLDLAMTLLGEIGAEHNFSDLLSQMVQQRNCVDGIIIPVSCPIVELDPMLATTSSDLHIIEHLYDGLLEVSPSDGSLRPGLAHHWEEQENGYCWYFWIRSGIRFHDGSQLDANDVVRTLNRLSHPSSQQYTLYMHISSVVALSPLKVEIRLTTPDPFLLQLLANPRSKIVACDGTSDPLGRFTFFGTGPFKLQQRSTHHLILRRHEYYWGVLPQLEQIEIWHLPPSDRSPSLWLHSKVEQPLLPNEVHQPHETAGCLYLIFHHLSPLWDDDKLRCAIWHHLEQDRCHVMDMVPAYSIFPSGYILPPINPDPPHRLQLDHPLRILASDIDSQRSQRDWLAHSLAKLGIECTWHLIPVSGIDRAAQEDVDLVLLGEVLDSSGEWGLFELLLSSVGVTMALGHKQHKQMAQTLRAHLSHCRPEERLSLVLQQETQLCHQYRYLPLFRQVEHVTFDSRLKGVVVNPQGYCSFKHLWLDAPELGVNICTPN